MYIDGVHDRLDPMTRLLANRQRPTFSSPQLAAQLALRMSDKNECMCSHGMSQRGKGGRFLICIYIPTKEMKFLKVLSIDADPRSCCATSGLYSDNQG